MISTLWNEILTLYKSITGTGAILVLFVVAVIVLFHTNKDSEVSLPSYLLAVWAGIGLAFVKVLNKAFDLEDDKRLRKSLGSIFVIILCLFVISISGKRIFSNKYLTASDNNLHLDSNLIDAFDAILAENENGVGVLMMNGYNTYPAAYSSRLHAAYEEPVNGDVSKYQAADMESYMELDKKAPNMYKVAKAAREDNCNYILLKDEVYWPKVPLTQLGFLEEGRFGDWILYRNYGEVTE